MRAALLILVISANLATAEVYSSVEDMKAVFMLERKIVVELLNLADKLKSKLNRIQRYVDLQYERVKCGFYFPSVFNILKIVQNINIRIVTLVCAVLCFSIF